MTFDCVTILVDLVLADVFEAWKEIYSEAMHLFLAFSSWPTLSQLKCFLERWTLSGNSTASTIGFFSPSHVAAKRQCCCRSREARIQMGWHCFFFFFVCASFLLIVWHSCWETVQGKLNFHCFRHSDAKLGLFWSLGSLPWL